MSAIAINKIGNTGIMIAAAFANIAPSAIHIDAIKAIDAIINLGIIATILAACFNIAPIAANMDTMNNLEAARNFGIIVIISLLSIIFAATTAHMDAIHAADAFIQVPTSGIIFLTSNSFVLIVNHCAAIHYFMIARWAAEIVKYAITLAHWVANHVPIAFHHAKFKTVCWAFAVVQK